MRLLSIIFMFRNQLKPEQLDIPRFKKVIFNFPPEKQLVLKSYKSEAQFVNTLSQLSQQYLGFKSLMKYEKDSKNIQQNSKINKNQEKWICQNCCAYFLFRWDFQQENYTIIDEKLTHLHQISCFDDYLIELFYQFSQVKAIKRLKKIDQTEEQQNRYEVNEEKSMNGRINIYQAGRKERPKQTLIEIKQKRHKLKVYAHKNWIYQTKKLISFIKPHRFRWPFQSDIPESLPSNLEPIKIQEFFRQIWQLSPELMNQIVNIKISQKVKNGNLKDKKIKLQCFCMSSLESRCPFSLVYELTGSGQFYKYCQSQSITEHSHIQIYVSYNQIKLFNQWYNYEDSLKHLCRKNDNVRKKSVNILVEIMRQRQQQNKSLFLFLLRTQIQFLFQNRYVIYTPNLTLNNEKQIYTNKLTILEQNCIKQDIILAIHPLMRKLFSIYNKFLTIQRINCNQYYSKHKQYSIFVFKGVGYTGSTIYFGFSVIQNSSSEKIQNMLNIFMTKHQITPNAVLVSQSDPILYDTVLKFYGQNYPQIIVQTREIYNYARQVPLRNGRISKFKFFSLNLIEVQKQYLQEMHQYGISINELYTFFQQDNLMRRNSCLLENRLFYGCNMINSCHFLQRHEKKPIGFETNIQNVRKSVWFLIQDIAKKNRKHKEKIFCFLQTERAVKIAQIQNLRVLMSKIPFQAFMIRLMQVSGVSVTINENPNFWIVESSYASNIITWNPSNKNPLLLCDCRIRQKTGIPCEHIIKIALIQDINLIECVDRYWLIDSYAASRHDVDCNNEHMMKSKSGPVHWVKENRKRIFEKIFHRNLVKNNQSKKEDNKNKLMKFNDAIQ